MQGLKAHGSAPGLNVTVKCYHCLDECVGKRFRAEVGFGLDLGVKFMRDALTRIHFSCDAEIYG